MLHVRLRLEQQPLCCLLQAVEYKQRIQAAVPAVHEFTPLMVLYLTDNTSPDEVFRAKEAGCVAFKLYPAGAQPLHGC